MGRFWKETLYFPRETFRISEAFCPQGLPHELRRQRLTKLSSEFPALRECVCVYHLGPRGSRLKQHLRSTSGPRGAHLEVHSPKHLWRLVLEKWPCEAKNNINKLKVIRTGPTITSQIGDKFGESLVGSQAPPSFWEVPGLPQKFPELPRKISATSPEVLSLWNLTAIQRFPGSFPDFPGSSPNFPGSSRTSPEVSPFLWEA